LGKDLVEETVGHLHDVVFGEARDLFAIVLARVYKRVAHDLLASRPRDELQALYFVVCEPILDARVEILFVLADDHDIHDVMLGFDEWVIRNAWPHIGIKAQRLARSDVKALESAALRGGDGRFEEDFGGSHR